jgi:hypothetical protein
MAVTLKEAKPFIEQAQLGQAQQQSALKQQIQQVSQAAPAGGLQPTVGKEAIQQTAAEVTKAQAAPVLQAEQAAAKQAQEQRAAQAQQLRLQKTQKLLKEKQTLTQQQTAHEERLANMNLGLKHELYDTQMKFAKDKMGRTIFTQQQLMDWAALKARNENDFRNYEQQAAQAIKRQEKVYNQAYKVIAAELDNQYAEAVQTANQERMRMIRDLKAEAEKKMQEAKARAAANGAIWSVGLGVVGAVIGGIYSGGAAAGAGYAIGSGLGSMAYSTLGSKEEVK